MGNGGGVDTRRESGAIQEMFAVLLDTLILNCFGACRMPTCG